MSALGQKQTCAVQDGMSALPPKASLYTIRSLRQDVPLAFHLSDYSMFSAISFVHALCFQRPNQLPFAERTAQFFGNFDDRVPSLMSS